jgi:mono/diheme cytochrome c family protein
MPRWLRRTAIALALVAAALAAVAGVATFYALVAYRKIWALELPATHASRDPAVIARGRYIVYGPGRCADCHSPDEERRRLVFGEEVPLTGGPGEHTYIGTWAAPNLTPDPATGLGRVSDGQLARMIRHGVNRDNRIAPPFMDVFADLAEDDLVAVISFLRSLPPAPGTPPSATINLFGKITLAYFLKPYAPNGSPPPHVTSEATTRYGEYIANTLAGCRSCHTARNLKTGAYLSPFFSGGLPFKSREQPGYMYVSPNLTPDPQTGYITTWTEDAFVQRFRTGLVIPDSPMPWGSFTRMTEADLRALYRYLRTLPPVRHDVGPVVQPEHGQVAGG